MKGNSISNAYSTFSGADSLAFIILPNTPPILLGNLTTISYSIYRDKKPVTLVGRINTAGFTRGSRVFAGTMIFTLINKHWINELIDQVPWLKKYGKMKADELPIFDIMVISANEYGAAVKMFILGIDFTDEGQVLSIEDMFTESQFSFIARDVDVFDAYTNNLNSDTIEPQLITKIYNDYLDTSISNKQVILRKLIPWPFLTTDIPIKQNLYKDNSDMISNEEVSIIQAILIAEGYEDTMEVGVYDTKTYENIKDYQSERGLPPTGILDDTTYSVMVGDILADSGVIGGVVTYTDGAPVYETANINAKLLKTIPYNQSVKISSNTNGWIKTEEGYIPSNYVYAYNNTPFSYPTLRNGDTGEEVLVLQKILNKINYLDANKGLTLTSVFDDETVLAVRDYQVSNDMPSDGIVDDEIWNRFKTEVTEFSPTTTQDGNGYSESFISIPTLYKTNSLDVVGSNYGVSIYNITKDITLKVSSIVHYENGKTETFSKNIEIKTTDISRNITLNDLQESLLYSMKHDSMPTFIEFIIYSKNNSPYKWNVDII